MPWFRTDNLRLERSTADTAHLWLDLAGRTVNVLNRPMLADLDAALDRVAAEPGLRQLVITSAKSGFVAGADIHDFAAIRSAEDAVALSAAGQRLFDKLARLPVITVATIHGSCLGGGLELALACDYRQAIDHPRTQFGFPELELGLLPAWGGTQRLPRLVGLERALRMILGTRRLDAGQALRWGLIDQVGTKSPLPADPAACPLQGGPREAVEFAEFTGKRPPRKWLRRSLRDQFIDTTPLGRWLAFRGAERMLRRQVPEDMPAPWEALKAIRVGLRRGMEAGLAYEREAAGRLATTNACRNLVGLFFEREKARSLPAEVRTGEMPSRRIGVVGAGTMGAGIAQLAAVKGFSVVVQEVNEAALTAGVRRIEGLFQKAAERGVLSAEEARQRLAEVRATTTWQGFDEVDVAIEAVLEDPQIKRSVFEELERHTRPGAVLATNTSSLPVAGLQEGSRHPGRIGGLHFFNPVHKMPLVEVIGAPATDPPTVRRLQAVAIALGKTPVVVQDRPGFVVNRILMPYLQEAVSLLSEGVPTAQIDGAMRRFGMPMGPLELLDQVGLDVAAHIARAMLPFFGDRFTPSPVFERMVERGWLGQKSGGGFYRYAGKEKAARPEVAGLLREGKSEAVTGQRPLTEADLREARERMVLVMVNEAAACLGEGVAPDAATIDLAMVLGTGWAPHRGGPLRYADDRGPSEVVQKLSRLERRHGRRCEPCAELQRRAAAGEPFYEAGRLAPVSSANEGAT